MPWQSVQHPSARTILLLPRTQAPSRWEMWGNFPRGPVVKTWPSNARGTSSIPDWGTKVWWVTWVWSKREKEKISNSGMSKNSDQGKAVRNDREKWWFTLPKSPPILHSATKHAYLEHLLYVWHYKSPGWHSRDQNPEVFYHSRAYSLVGKTDTEGSERGMGQGWVGSRKSRKARVFRHMRGHFLFELPSAFISSLGWRRRGTGTNNWKADAVVVFLVDKVLQS